jgi:hypothetical protein
VKIEFELTDDMKLMILTESVKYPEHAVVKYRIGDIQGELVDFKKVGDKYDAMLMVGTEKLFIQDVKLSEVELVSWPDICDGPRLIETTMRGYDRRTYLPGIGAVLTEEEKRIVAESKEYAKQYEADENKRVLKLAYKAFEQLRDIAGMPDDAIKILREWVTLEDDFNEYEDA